VVGFRSRHCPRGQTLNEDNTYSLHVTPPLRKHTVTAMCPFLFLTLLSVKRVRAQRQFLGALSGYTNLHTVGLCTLAAALLPWPWLCVDLERLRHVCCYWVFPFDDPLPIRNGRSFASSVSDTWLSFFLVTPRLVRSLMIPVT
jgi:hypothetical protein